MPIGIVLLNQVRLPVATPVLQLLFARDGSWHVLKHLKADEPVDVVVFGKPRNEPLPMLV